MAERLSLAVTDYVVIACMLSVSLGVGIYLAIKGKKRGSTEDYLLGSRKLHVLPVTLSMFVTFMSSTSLMGVPAETYTTGSDFSLHSVGMSLSCLVGIFTVVPIMHPLKVTSMYEYFQLRFQSLTLRLMVTLIGMCQKIIFTAVVLLAPAISVQTATGLPFWVSVVIVGGVGIIYTSIGGIRGVVLVDVFQTAVILIGIFSVIIKGVIDIGGLEATWKIAVDGNRVQPVNFDPDPRVRHSIWALVLGGMFSFFAYTFDQSAVQRICSIPTITGAKIVYAVNIFMPSIYIVALCFMGIVAYSYFVTKECDPFKSGILTNKNQLMPFFVMKLFNEYPGMTGLYLATVFSGALSTVSSVINGLAANTIEDLLRRPFSAYRVSENTKLLTAKLAVCFYGGLCIGLAFLARNLTGSFIQTAVGILGALGGPIVGIFFLGALIPWANKIGAISGVLLSLILNIWLTIGAVLYGQKPEQLPSVPGNSCLVDDIVNDNFTTTTAITTSAAIITTPLSSIHVAPERSVYDISYQYYGLTGWLVSFIFGLLVSLVSYRWCQSELEERYFFPIVRNLWKSKYAYVIADTTETKEDLQLDDINLYDHQDTEKATRTS